MISNEPNVEFRFGLPVLPGIEWQSSRMRDFRGMHSNVQ